MSQLHFYAPDEIETQIRDKAKRSNLALYVASKKTVAPMLQKRFPQLRSFEFDDNAAKFYARIRVDLTVQGNLIGANDLMVTAIARANNATLITTRRLVN